MKKPTAMALQDKITRQVSPLRIRFPDSMNRPTVFSGVGVIDGVGVDEGV